MAMSPLHRALKKKFRRPQDVLVALGLDENLLRLRPKLAMDSGGENIKVRLEKFLCEHLQGEELEIARQMLHDLEAPNEGDIFDSEAEQNDQDEIHRDQDEIERRLDRAGSQLREHGLSEADIEEALDLARHHIRAGDNWGPPKNATKGGLGGRFSERQASDRKLMARDARDERRFLDRFPEAKRLAGAALEGGISGSAEELMRLRRGRIATDAASDQGFFDRYPTAGRIGVA
jgi:hypothetical protein